jgi:hypothetical protein
MISFKRWFVVAVGAGCLASGAMPGAYASDNSATILPAEGNVQCSDYAANGTIISMGTSKAVASGSVTGSENPMDADTTGEAANYVITGGTLLAFSATTPVDYAVLKSGNTVAVFMYSSGGETSDANMSIKGNLAISSFQLCYGLGNQPPPPPPPQTLKSCNTDPDLDATGVGCPTSGQRTLVCNFELDKEFYGLSDGSDTCCVCNAAALTECDASKTAGEPGACVESTGSKVGAEVTTNIQLNNDPYVCSTSSGKTTCFKY